MRKVRRHYSPREKVAILRRHLLDKVARLCDELQLQPTVFYRWLQLAAPALADPESAIGQHIVYITAPGNTALDIAEYASKGGAMRKVVRGFTKRTTDPNQDPLTYDEARQFNGKASSRFSAEEAQRTGTAGQTPAVAVHLRPGRCYSADCRPGGTPAGLSRCDERIPQRRQAWELE